MGCASKLCAAGAGETDARVAPGPYAEKTVAQLKEVLRTRSLTTTGRKADLLERLAANDAAAAATTAPDVTSAAAAGAAAGER